MAQQFKVSVPYEKRTAGWLYDWHSGLCMGIASDQQKKKHPPNVPFDQSISGCPHKLVIHPPPIKVNAAAILRWVYKRKKGDLEVYASNKSDALQAIKTTGLVKNIDPDKLSSVPGKLSDVLKQEPIT